MKLNQAVSLRLQELLQEYEMTQYQLFSKSGVPKSTISNLIHCSYDSVKLRIVHRVLASVFLIFSSLLCLKKSIWTHKAWRPEPGRRFFIPVLLGAYTVRGAPIQGAESAAWRQRFAP